MQTEADAGSRECARPRRQRVPAPATLGPVQVLRHTGLTEWQWRAGTAAGLIQPADDVAARRAAIVNEVGAEAPVGGHKAADRLSARTGLQVCKEDVDALAAAGLLSAAGSYKGWPLWDCREVDAVDVEQGLPRTRRGLPAPGRRPRPSQHEGGALLPPLPGRETAVDRPVRCGPVTRRPADRDRRTPAA